MVTAQVYNTTPSAIGSTLSLENTRARAASQSTPGLQFDGKNAKAVCGLLIAGLTVQLGRPFAPRSIERRLSKTMSFCKPAPAAAGALQADVEIHHRAGNTGNRVDAQGHGGRRRRRGRRQRLARRRDGYQKLHDRVVVEVEASIDDVGSRRHRRAVLILQIPGRAQLILECRVRPIRRARGKKWIAAALFADRAHARVAYVYEQNETRIEHAAVRLNLGDCIAQRRDTGFRVRRTIRFENDAIERVRPLRTIDAVGITVSQLAGLKDLERHRRTLLAAQLGRHLHLAGGTRRKNARLVKTADVFVAAPPRGCGSEVTGDTDGIVIGG